HRQSWLSRRLLRRPWQAQISNRQVIPSTGKLRILKWVEARQAGNRVRTQCGGTASFIRQCPTPAYSTETTAPA
ncbi:MAG TPA: hypothetical protein VN454_00805, partial [Candidatus Angelobacter sp.]|nr:hypothetical protein [Candidatus Angelobacter sp.]